ncbi:unnamed protein product [Symbiodinium sp. CCMP2592]|nr:unnamed protein product [Symbiodinium sp. CCMP2592]
MPGSFEGSEADRRSASDRFESQICSLIEMYGSETPFAPKPWIPSAVQGPSENEPDELPKGVEDEKRSLPHVFRFLPNVTGVWTVLQVDEASAVEGYRHFIAVAEWYRFKTPFTQWFTKNYSGNFLPLAHMLEIGGGHVRYPVTFVYAQVARRTTYKGQVKDLTCLPVDACTVPGILVLLATLLPTASFGPEGVAESVSFMERLEQHMNMNQSVQLLPFAQTFKVDVRENKLPVEQIKAILSDLGLSWSRFAKRMTGSTIGIMMPFSVFLTTSFRLKGDPEFCNSLGFRRLTKRAAHIWAQEAELTLERCVVVDCPDPTLATKYHPFMKSSRRRGNKTLRMHMVSRFLCRGAGYISMKDEKSLGDLGVVDAKSTLADRTSSEYVGRLLLKAEATVSDCLQRQRLRCLNFCFDATSFAGEQVLSVVYRMDGLHFAGATQLLPVNTCSKTEAVAAAVALSSCLEGVLPDNAKSRFALPKDAHSFREFRTPTKHLLSGLANSLQQAMPAGWTLQGCIPPNPLLPAARGCDRLPFEEVEKSLLNPKLAQDAKVYFVWDPEASEGRQDFYVHEDFVRLVFGADEGTEGFVGWQHLCSQNLWAVFWPDLFHKAARKAGSAIRRLEEGPQFLRRLMTLFRFSRGPFKSSRFGRTVAEARDHLLRLLKEDPNSDFVQLWLTGMAKDEAGWCNVGGPASSDFSGTHAVALLEKRKGVMHLRADTAKDVRWFSFYDYAVALDKCWHTEAMAHCFSLFVEGKNPWGLNRTGDASEVLADDTNQDKTRAFIVVFKALRIYVADCARDFQNSGSASMSHYISLATGKKVGKLIVKTFENAAKGSGLVYCGATSDEESLEWVAKLFLFQIDALCDLDAVYRSFPWASIACLHESSKAATLQSMRMEWEFVRDCIDKLPSQHELYWLFSFTRYQAYRDVMIKAETMSFRPEAMDEECGLPFTEVCRVVAGMTGEKTDSVLSSLPCELTFNDLRDSGRRHAKAEKTVPQNIHAIAQKSSSRRPAGGQALSLTAEDWSTPLSHKYVKSRVHSILKATDVELGISSEGLTKHRSSKHYTKPHILSQRLDLMRLLAHEYHEQIADVRDGQDRLDMVQELFKSLWICKLVPEHVFVSWKKGEEVDTRFLVLRAGPHCLRVLPLVKFGDSDDDVFSFKEMKVPRLGKAVTDITEVVISQTSPVIAHDQLGWRQTSAWMTLQQYVADVSILTIPRGLLAAVCTELGLKHGKMDYKARVHLFLLKMGKSEQEIQNILEEIPDSCPRKKRNEEDEHLEGQTSDEEEEELLEEMAEDPSADDDAKQGSDEPKPDELKPDEQNPDEPKTVSHDVPMAEGANGADEAGKESHDAELSFSPEC